MTTRLTFDLDAVCQLAEHAAAAATGTSHTGTGRSGPALLLRSGRNGIWLASNAAHAQAAPAGQPGTLKHRAAFAQQCPPGTPARTRAALLRNETTPLMHVLPVDKPGSDPLLQQLRAAYLAGATTLTVHLQSGATPSVALGRHRKRGTRPAQPAADARRTRWQDLPRRYRTVPHSDRIHSLMARIDRCRDDITRLHQADLALAGFGILASRGDIGAATAAIRAEATAISIELHALGAHEAARRAADGWDLTFTRQAATPADGN